MILTSLKEFIEGNQTTADWVPAVHPRGSRSVAGHPVHYARVVPPSLEVAESLPEAAFQELIDRFEPANAEAALVHGLAATAGLSRWIDGGTLLGLERDGQFIAHDTDVDIAVCLTMDQALALQLPSNDIVRTIRWNHLPMQHAYLVNDTIVDLYFYYSDIEPDLLVNTNTEGLLRIPAHLVLPIDEGFRWNGHSIPVPRMRHEYLAWSYGATWTTPAVSKSDWWEEHAHLDPSSLADGWELPAHHERIASIVGTADAQRHEAVSRQHSALAERDRFQSERDDAFAQCAEAREQRDRASHEAAQARQDLATIHRSRAWHAVARYYTARTVAGNALRRRTR